MSTAAKILILTWVVIGIVVVGVAGFFVGRLTVPKPLTLSGGLQQGQQQQFQQQPGGSPPTGGGGQQQQQQQLPGGGGYQQPGQQGQTPGGLQ